MSTYFLHFSFSFQLKYFDYYFEFRVIERKKMATEIAKRMRDVQR